MTLDQLKARIQSEKMVAVSMAEVEKDRGFIVTFKYAEKPGGVIIHMKSKTQACVVANVDKIFEHRLKVEGERDA